MLKCVKARTRQADRIEVPTFYTMKRARGGHKIYFGFVFTLNTEYQHPTPGYVLVGLVSQQSPLGQGTTARFKRSELRRASKKEVLRALRHEHLFGSSFHPPEILRGSGRWKQWPLITWRQRKVILTAYSIR